MEMMASQLPIDYISKKMAPELLTAIFQFLPYDDLKNALLVCRWDEKPSIPCGTIKYNALRLKIGNFSVSCLNCNVFSDMCRWWREVGEGPIFWTGFKLSFNIHKLSEEKLFEVLSLQA